MTEEEAKTKWCPSARSFSSTGESATAVNQEAGKPCTPCIASACMMWRWGQYPTAWICPPGGGEGVPTRFAQSNTDGYCGLAGKP